MVFRGGRESPDDHVLRLSLVSQGEVGFSELFDETGRSPRLPPYKSQGNKSGLSPPSDWGTPLEPGALGSPAILSPHHVSQTALSPAGRTWSGASYYAN